MCKKDLKQLFSQKPLLMKIALIGYGRMGREVEKAARHRGHTISLIIDQDNLSDLNTEKLRSVDVAIEFTTPDTAFDNICSCLSAGLPVVSGTTGWLDKYDEAASLALKKGAAFLYASNFSLGVNILFNLNRRLAGIMNGINEYSVEIEESHHTKKLDAPSGTAIKLAEDILSGCNRYQKWTGEDSASKENIGIRSVREGDIPGTHKIRWTSGVDSIRLEHEAFSREGFAVGAVFAAEYIMSRKGVFSISDMLGF